MAADYSKFVQYIKNAGGQARTVKIKHFDEDWEPIGPALRKEMLQLGLIERDGPGNIKLPDTPL